MCLVYSWNINQKKEVPPGGDTIAEKLLGVQDILSRQRRSATGRIM